jgi:hypothetical protein
MANGMGVNVLDINYGVILNARKPPFTKNGLRRISPRETSPSTISSRHKLVERYSQRTQLAFISYFEFKGKISRLYD